MPFSGNALFIASGVWAISKTMLEALRNYLGLKKGRVEAENPEAVRGVREDPTNDVGMKIELETYLEAERSLKGSAYCEVDSGIPVIPQLSQYDDLTLKQKLMGFLYRNPQPIYLLQGLAGSALILMMNRFGDPDKPFEQSMEESATLGATLSFTLNAFQNFRTARTDVQETNEYCSALKTFRAPY